MADAVAHKLGSPRARLAALTTRERPGATIGSRLLSTKPSFATSLVAGALAGTTVDISLFPLDTIKTRLQAPSGFLAAGGFRGLHRGIASAAVGAAPTAALFFCSYEILKPALAASRVGGGSQDSPMVHMLAASAAEAVACITSVPTENVKQKLQVGHFGRTSACVGGILRAEGPLGFFRGYAATVAREVPFSAIQFPIYEGLKELWARSRPGGSIDAYQAAVCGSVAGALAGLVTCPLDVAKTRLMLGKDRHGRAYSGMLPTLQRIFVEGGVAGLFAGVGPRVAWMSAGGFVFLGSYEQVKASLMTDEA
jgi:solute carrier family 25 S-adenosylmethionine transporter 26